MLLVFQNFSIVAEIYMNWIKILLHNKIKLALPKKVPGLGNSHL